MAATSFASHSVLGRAFFRALASPLSVGISKNFSHYRTLLSLPLTTSLGNSAAGICQLAVSQAINGNVNGLLRGVGDKNTNEAVKHIVELAKRASSGGEVLHTDFLTPLILKESMLVLEKFTDIKTVAQGGYPEAERCRLSVGHPQELTSDPDIVVALSITGNFGFQPCSHGDFLGSILGTGIAREALGDILVQGEGAQILIVPELADFITSTLDKVGNVPVTCEKIPLLALEYKPPRTQTFKTVEPSLRVDAIASAGFKISRTKLVDLIRSGDVRVNWTTVTKGTTTMKTGDIVSVSGKGRLKEEESEEYGSPIVLASTIADIIKSRTESLLKKTRSAVSSKPIVMRAEYAHCPNLTIIDTPGFVLKAKKGEPENTPEEILSMVKSLASPPNRIVLFLQQSSVEWCSSLWLDAVREIDPTFRRIVVVVSKFDNRLKEFTDRWEVDRYLSASGYLGENIKPFFVALPKDRNTVSNDEFRRQISQVDLDVIHHLREGVKGGFDEEKFSSYIGFSCLRDYLESELQKRYKEATPATLALLEQRCSEVTAELSRMETKIQATSDVSHLRKSAMLHAASICNHVGALIDGAADPAPEQWGKTTNEEQSESGIGSWPGITADIKPPNATLRLYGGAAFERVMHEFRCATYSVECPPVSREKVANILLAHAGRGGGRGLTEAAAEIARAAAQSWLAPLLDTACDRLAFVLGNLFDLAVERNHCRDSGYGRKTGDMDGYVGFHAALRHSYSRFLRDIAKQCKQLVRHHLDSITSPYSQVCYENDFLGTYGSGASYTSKSNQASATSFCLELSDRGHTLEDEPMKDQENIPPEKNAHQTTPGKVTEAREVLRESQMTVPETPSPDQPSDGNYVGVKKELGNCIEVGARKRHPRIVGNSRNSDHLRVQNGGGLLFRGGDSSSRSGSAYSEICSLAAQHFARIREVLVERSVTSTLNSSFLTPCRDRLVVALGLDLFAVNDEKFMDMFVAPGAIDILQNERQSLQKRQKILHSCLTEFKTVARTL